MNDTMNNELKKIRILNLIRTEFVRASEMHPTFNSFHEGYAVILEEMDELKAEVWKKTKERDLEKMREEAVQIAAMAMRFLYDLLETE